MWGWLLSSNRAEFSGGKKQSARVLLRLVKHQNHTLHLAGVETWHKPCCRRQLPRWRNLSVVTLFFVCCVFRQVKYRGINGVPSHSAVDRNLILRLGTCLKSTISQLKVFHLPQECWWELSKLTRSQEAGLPTYPVRVRVYILCYPQATFHPTWPLVTIRKVRTQIPVRISRPWFGLDILEDVNSNNCRKDFEWHAWWTESTRSWRGGERRFCALPSNVFENEHSEENLKHLKGTGEENEVIRSPTHAPVLRWEG